MVFLGGRYWDQYYLTSLSTTWTVGLSVLRKFVDDTKLCGEVYMLEGRDAIQRGLARLECWASVNLMNLHKAKCKVPHLG